MSAKSWYKKNYTPDQIKEIQRTLGVEEDGLIGPDTLRAIKEYQEAVGVKADGLWGKATQAKADEWNDEYNSFVPNRTVSNPNKELYKEYAKNLEKKYFQDERNRYESNFSPNYEMSNVELAYLNKEIDKVKKQLADRQAKYESVPQPKTQVGWSSYIVNNDRGMLDKYQDAERAWYNKMADQAHAKELAKAQRQEQREHNLNSARDTLAKLQVMRNNAEQQGHDYRDIDVQIASIYRDYPELKVQEEVTKEYDPRKSVEYVLADVEDINENNTPEEIQEAIDKVSKYKTPESIKVLNKLDKSLAKRIKKEESQDTYNNEINSWINGGDTTKYLYNLGLETQFAGDKERLVNKKTGRIVAERLRNRPTPTPRPSSSTTPSTKPSKSSWEL